MKMHQVLGPSDDPMYDILRYIVFYYIEVVFCKLMYKW